MADVVRLDPHAYRRTPWKNGGGVTVDIADAYMPGAEPGSWSGMLWRLGRTEIVAPGPFSDLSGYDRILTVIGGRGLVLDIEGGAALDVREPYRPVRFRGEDRIVSRLEAGPVAVLNLIADRRHHIDVAVLSGTDARAVDAPISIVGLTRRITSPRPTPCPFPWCWSNRSFSCRRIDAEIVDVGIPWCKLRKKRGSDWSGGRLSKKAGLLLAACRLKCRFAP